MGGTSAGRVTGAGPAAADAAASSEQHNAAAATPILIVYFFGLAARDHEPSFGNAAREANMPARETAIRCKAYLDDRRVLCAGGENGLDKPFCAEAHGIVRR